MWFITYYNKKYNYNKNKTTIKHCNKTTTKKSKTVLWSSAYCTNSTMKIHEEKVLHLITSIDIYWIATSFVTSFMAKMAVYRFADQRNSQTEELIYVTIDSFRRQLKTFLFSD